MGSWKGPTTFGFLKRAHYLWVPEKGPLPLGPWKGPATFGVLKRVHYLWGPEKGQLPLGPEKGPLPLGPEKGPLHLGPSKRAILTSGEFGGDADIFGMVTRLVNVASASLFCCWFLKNRTASKLLKAHACQAWSEARIIILVKKSATIMWVI